jgi:hypothetical protein
MLLAVGTNPRGWLFTIMHNQNVNGVRRKVRECIAVEFYHKWSFSTAPTDPTAGLTLRDLDRALARICERQRQLILLIGLDGISYEEAATMLEVPLGTIRSRLSRGREALRTLMDRRGGTEPAISAGSLGERERHVKQIAISHVPSKEARPLQPWDLEISGSTAAVPVAIPSAQG